MSQGERGPHGDHGQTGEQGLIGAQGQTGKQGVQGIQGEQGVRGIQGEQDRGRKWKAALTAWIVIFTIIVFYSLSQIRHNTSTNKATIAQIQVDRVKSCQQTYRSINDIFKPFFVPPATPQQRTDRAKFEKLVADHIAACRKQTGVSP